MFSKYLIPLFVIVFTSFSVFSQLMYESNNNSNPRQNFTELQDKNEEIKDITDFNFKRRRYANVAFFAELGGAAWNYSLNIEPILESKEKHMFTARLGVGILPSGSSMELNFPLLINFLYGRKNHLDLGIGINFHMDNDGSQIIPVGNIGFRHQHPRGGFIYKFSFNPYFPREDVGGRDEQVFRP